jgi:hypothetical protein
MPEAHLRRARVDQPLTVSSMNGTQDVLRPGEYYVEDVGTNMRLHRDSAGEFALAEVGMQAFDALLTQRQVVFLSWRRATGRRASPRQGVRARAESDIPGREAGADLRRCGTSPLLHHAAAQPLRIASMAPGPRTEVRASPLPGKASSGHWRRSAPLLTTADRRWPAPDAG